MSDFGFLGLRFFFFCLEFVLGFCWDEDPFVVLDVPLALLLEIMLLVEGVDCLWERGLVTVILASSASSTLGVWMLVVLTEYRF